MQKMVMVMLLVLGLAMVAQAELVPIVNGDFEDTSVVYPNGPPAGWDAGGAGVGVFDLGGENVCLFNTTVGNSQTLFQNVGHEIVSGATYDFSIDFFNGPDLSATSLPWWDSLSVQLWARTPVTNDLNPIILGTVTHADFSTPNEWKTFSYQYVDDGTYAGHTLFVQFQVQGGIQPSLDNVTLMETIPEPMTMTLLGFGSGLMFLRRKK